MQLSSKIKQFICSLNYSSLGASEGFILLPLHILIAVLMVMVAGGKKYFERLEDTNFIMSKKLVA